MTTVRGGNVLFENDGRGRFQGHLQGRRRRLRRPLLRGGLLRLRQGRAAGSVRLQRRPVHDRREGPRRRLRRPDGCLLRPPASAIAPSTSILYRNLGRNQFRNVTTRRRARRRRLERRCERRGSERRRLPGPVRPQHAGRDHYFENAGGREFVDKTAQYFPRTPWGSMGDQVLRLRQRRPAGSAHHRHALGHERGGRPGAREAEVANTVDGRPGLLQGGPGQVHLRQRLLQESRGWQVRGDLGPHGRGELLALGAERRRLERRRLAGRLHHRVDELSHSATASTRCC